MKQIQIKLNFLINRMYKLSKEIEDTAYQLQQLKNEDRPRCDKCKIANIRLRMDNTYHCRTCGFDSSKKIEGEKE